MSLGAQWLFVGTQRSGDGTGFSRLSFDTATGALTPPDLAAIAPDPSFFVVSGDYRHLYACHSGTPGGVGAYGVDAATGELRPLGQHVSIGRGPSQLSLDHAGRFVLAANYAGGYVEVIAIGVDGTLGRQTAFVQHSGSSVHPDRQTRPYVHCAVPDPTNRFVLAADLGTDEVVIYRLHEARGTLTLHDPRATPVPPGSGPRHLAWNPNGVSLYLIEELSSEVTVFHWDAARGALTSRQTISALPHDFHGANTAAEVLVHPSGNFLYASNRGHDSIVVFRVAPGDGLLDVEQFVSSRGRTPRYLALDATGRWLVAANCDSDSLAVFGIDHRSGHLTPTGVLAAISRPYGLAFAPKA
jgi:6-phosphogluconolactonase